MTIQSVANCIRFLVVKIPKLVVKDDDYKADAFPELNFII
jgi:hypothetical protein